MRLKFPNKYLWADNMVMFQIQRNIIMKKGLQKINVVTRKTVDQRYIESLL